MSVEHHDTDPKWKGVLPMTAGILALIVLAGGLGLWSVQAQISGAMIVPGQVSAETNRLAIQHPEGGTGFVSVQDGDRVEKGDVLIQLDGRRARNELSLIEVQLSELSARMSRLQAERDDADEVNFEPDLIRREKMPNVDKLLEAERLLFSSRKASLDQEIRLIRQQNQQIKDRIAGLKKQLDALREQSALSKVEMVSAQQAVDHDPDQDSRISELKKDQAELKSRIGRIEAESAKLRGSITNKEIALLKLMTQRRENAVKRLRELQNQEVKLFDRQFQLRDSISNLEIRAPIDGIIYGLKVSGVQSAVRAGKPLMYVFPEDQPLVVSARVDATLIDAVYEGQKATLQFSLFGQREVVELDAVVRNLSTDKERNGAAALGYHSVEITPESAEISKLKGQIPLPGTPVNCFIKTGARSPLAYLTGPIADFYDKAFRN